MMKKLVKLTALLLALVMVTALLPATALAARADSTAWTVSKSKTATALDSSDETTVTLSLPSAETTQTSDVVFVVDASDCAGSTLPQMVTLLGELEAAQEKTKATIKIGIIFFRGSAVTYADLEELTQDKIDAWKTTITGFFDGNGAFDKIKLEAALLTIDKDYLYSGSNLHSGLQAAQSMLSKDGDVSADRKYVITVSDGITYLFNDAKGNTKAIYDEYNSYYAECCLEAWRSEKVSGGYVMKKNWDEYYSDISDLVAKDQDTYVADYRNVCEKTNMDPGAARFLDESSFTSTGYTRIEKAEIAEHALGVDRSVYECCKTYSEMAAAGYQCYYIQPNKTYGSTTFPYQFAAALNTIAGKSTDIDFTTIKDRILYALAKGTVTDGIGNSFKLDASAAVPFTVTLDGAALTAAAVKGKDNEWTFGTADEDGNFPYSVSYDADAKTITWAISVPVENAHPVTLSYKLRLTNRQSAAGTYGVNDLKGENEKNTAGIFTNESATLDYVDSQGKTGSEAFPRPSVSYTVEEEIIINPPIPTGLDGEDHFAYIIGRDDGLIHPEASITRAEIATIFFRLLTDETRQAYYATTNNFSDVDSSMWYNTAVSTLANMGIINGYSDGMFRPGNAITRAEFATIAARFTDYGYSGDAVFTDIYDNYWAAADINKIASLGWVTGYEDGSYHPNAQITRAEAITIINRVLHRNPGDEADLLSSMVKWPDNADPAAWYYLSIQEATNSHEYTRYDSDKKETWTKLTENKDWSEYEKTDGQ